MNTYKFGITETTTGVLVVNANSLEEAYDKVYGMDGDFFGYNTTVSNINHLEEE